MKSEVYRKQIFTLLKNEELYKLLFTLKIHILKLYTYQNYISGFLATNYKNTVLNYFSFSSHAIYSKIKPASDLSNNLL